MIGSQYGVLGAVVQGGDMAVDFRGHPMFPSTGFNAPTRFEADLYDCEVWGAIPSDIEGNFYRMQCDFQYRPPQNEWPTGFNGDGHVSRFHFRDGNAYPSYAFDIRCGHAAHLADIDRPWVA